ncbi:PP2C family protein-serine/threonine phosphatase [Streptomyces griseosporeus]|uniref:PP2C family protein-serine/threonine phosphatase n=1 Tax=Streptomyces griseosporeus TaxID=1910 RepID=UPI0036FBFC9A
MSTTSDRRYDAPAAPGASGGAATPDDKRRRLKLVALDALLTAQQRRIRAYALSRAAPAGGGPGSGGPLRPAPAADPSARHLLDALPFVTLTVTPLLDGRDRVRDFLYTGQNSAARASAGRVVPPGTLPPWTGPVPLFERFPHLADTPVPRMLAEAHRTGRVQGPEPAEWSLVAPDGTVVRMSHEVRVAPCGDLLLLIWERGQHSRTARAAQRLVRVCWAEWNLGDGTVETSLGLRGVLGLPPAHPLPSLADLGRMLAADSVEPFYQAVYDVLLRKRVTQCDLRLVEPRERIVHFVAEPVRAEAGPVWTLRAVLHDVTEERRSRALAEQALREARAQRERADALVDVAERLRDAVVPRFPSELARYGVEAAAVYRPEARTARVGGDWYKTRMLPSGQVLIALGDARGHGLDAVTLMAKLRYALAGLAFTGRPVEELTAWLNEVACDDGDESTATAVIARFHPDRNLLRWTCAGHPCPLLVRGSDVTLLGPPQGGPGMPLGVLPGERYTAGQTLMGPGDVVLLYSDGLIERRGSDLGRDSGRLLRTARAAARDGIPPGSAALDAYVQQLVDRLTGPHTEDDATVLAFRRVA